MKGARMRRSLDWAFLLTLVAVSGCGKAGNPAKPASAPRPAPSLFRAYFAGTSQLATNTNAAHWLTMAALPASQALKEQTLRKLSQAPFGLFQQRIDGTTNDYAPIFQALLGDLLAAESFAEVTGDTNQFTEFELAVRLSADRAEFWRTNLQVVLESWTGGRAEPLPAAQGAGWQLKRERTPNLVRLVRAGAWTVVGCGQDGLRLQTEWLQRIKGTGSPTIAEAPSWLELWLDSPNLPPIPGRRLPGELPAIHLRLTGSGENLRTKVDFICRNRIEWSAQPWLVPTNIIRDPIISFTAVQGVAPFLKKLQDALRIRVDSTSDQLFVWARSQIPYQTFAALASPDPRSLLDQLAPQIMAGFNANVARYGLGPVAMTTNENALVWQSVPFVAPFAEPARDGSNGFLLVGLFPNIPPTNPPPPELWLQFLGRTNLVYYDWEITQERLVQWRTLGDLFQILFKKPRLKDASASVVWLNSISASLGNSASEIALTSSNRLTLSRTSPVGLTAFELVALANWLESPGFPLNGYSLPARTGALRFPRTNASPVPGKP